MEVGLFLGKILIKVESNKVKKVSNFQKQKSAPPLLGPALLTIRYERVGLKCSY